MKRSTSRTFKRVSIYTLVVVVGLSLSFVGSSMAWLAAGGNMYAEPCHSLLWCE
jgi:hypothetical protein